MCGLTTMTTVAIVTHRFPGIQRTETAGRTRVCGALPYLRRVTRRLIPALLTTASIREYGQLLPGCRRRPPFRTMCTSVKVMLMWRPEPEIRTGAIRTSRSHIISSVSPDFPIRTALFRARRITGGSMKSAPTARYTRVKYGAF